jgi:hypothetical protein
LLYQSKPLAIGEASRVIIHYHVKNDGLRASYRSVHRFNNAAQRASSLFQALEHDKLMYGAAMWV